MLPVRHRSLTELAVTSGKFIQEGGSAQPHCALYMRPLLHCPRRLAWFVAFGLLAGLAPRLRAEVDLQPFEYAKGSLNEQEDRADTPRTGKVLLCLAGDSTATYSQGYGAGFRACLDRQLQVINRSRGGRTTASFRSDGRWQDILNLKPD